MALKFVPENKGPAVVKAKNSNTISDEYRDSLAISYSFIGAEDADTTFEFAGEKFQTPIMAGPIPVFNSKMGTDYEYAKGVMEAGSIYWNHYHAQAIHERLLAEGAKVVRVIKPMRDMEEVLNAIKYDTQHGALGYSMDISHGRSVYGEPDGHDDSFFGPKSVDDIKRIIDASPLPFYPKDVMSVRDAVLLKELGADGVVLSGHNNRFPCAIPPLKLLEEVRAAVGPDFKIFVDGGLNNGYDAFKAFALGADGVLSARALLGAFTNGGSIGVAKKILEMNAELKGAMCATCSPDLKHINRDCIIKM